jgi:hypothetical protein
MDNKTPSPTEHAEQAALFRWAEFESHNKPMLKLLAAVPNGANKSMATAMKFKREGLRAGFPDIIFAYPCGGYCGLFIELKRKTKSHTTDEQKWWLTSLALVGYKTALCHGFEEARQVILEYLELPVHIECFTRRKALADMDLV